MFDDKAQLHTLEGIAAASIILLVIIYAIDATSMTPLTSSTASVHMESELRALGQDILNTLDHSEPGYTSKLKGDVATWNGTEYIWNGGVYFDGSDTQNNLTNNLTQIFRSILVDQSISHNVKIIYLDEIDNVTLPVERYMIYNGAPSTNAVVVSRKIVLHNGDFNKTFYPGPLGDIDLSTELYNIADVKIILWRL